MHVHCVLCLVTQAFLTLCDPMDYSPPDSSVPGDSPGKNTGVGCHSLLQGIFLTQGSNPGLQHRRRILYHLSHQGSLWMLEWVAYPFSRVSSPSRNCTGVSCIADGFFTSWATREACIITILKQCFVQIFSTLLPISWLIIASQIMLFSGFSLLCHEINPLVVSPARVHTWFTVSLCMSQGYSREQPWAKAWHKRCKHYISGSRWNTYIRWHHN